MNIKKFILLFLVVVMLIGFCVYPSLNYSNFRDVFSYKIDSITNMLSVAVNSVSFIFSSENEKVLEVETALAGRDVESIATLIDVGVKKAY